jgi:VIT1/CCC1 family predicted Fe2+/Mn2+ transporter
MVDQSQARLRGMLTGVFFGNGSGVITTLGLIVGLFAGTESLAAVMGGILVIAVSDSMSDAFGIHLSEEARPDSTSRSVWLATIATLLTKFLMASTFVLPLLLLPLQQAVIACLIWGAVVLTVLSVFIARQQGQPALPVVAEHLGIASLVMVLSWLVGMGVNRWLGV